MPVKRTYVIGILNDNAISEVNDVISKYAINTHDTSSHMYFLKHPIDLTLVTHDVIFFQIDLIRVVIEVFTSANFN